MRTFDCFQSFNQVEKEEKQQKQKETKIFCSFYLINFFVFVFFLNEVQNNYSSFGSKKRTKLPCSQS